MMTTKRILLLLVSLLSAVATVRAQIDVDRVITIGRNALYFNDYVVSIGYFNQVVDLRPWMAEPYFYRGIAKISLEDYTGAEADATACLQRNALIPKAYFLRGVARQNLGKIDSAILDYQRGLELRPNDEGMLVNLAGTLTDSKRYAEARKGVADLLRFYPKSKQAHLALSGIELGEQDTTAAIRELQQVLRMDSLFA
ncbi:tetratricopeptide repeat protein, partial [Porphyromonas loveana]|uniref:tetratricopeptide repeat protein n=1 Tax=Porphyromonas loveana TaxID=1884669 RepID=UPI0035A157F1